ncbi:MAG: hypothetical protein COA96_07155 [SAR86 cluster bacterium]|uniref:Metallo-beta-lactamase domain-containing protein n=1 Tax=SAR86 cluster bacterium TaxID=2030880 RepID=A0A2A5B239_9GAMM|nr:MAG: hypothetical protein COA96_07155 [SAR86 cluster bacterium]
MSSSDAGVARPVANTSIPVKKILGRNPGPMTGPGTNSYLIGRNKLALLDPGPKDDAQFESFMQAIGDGSLEYIFITHTHADHSPGALKLKEATGATLVGLPAPPVVGHDKTFAPEREWQDGEIIQCGEGDDGFSVQLIYTPGHVSNHICYLLQEEQLLFTGDHVLQGTTPVILPPDGDMSAYLDSLTRLQDLSLRALAPGHGNIMTEPQAEIAKLIAHRLKREKKIVDKLAMLGQCDMDKLVHAVYDDVAAHLIPWAKKTLLAHLIKLERDKVVSSVGDTWLLIQA